MSQSRGGTASEPARVEPVLDSPALPVEPAGAHLPDALVDSLDVDLSDAARVGE